MASRHNPAGGSIPGSAVSPPSLAIGQYGRHRPDWFTRHVLNRLVILSTRLGVSVWGSRVLEHRGRRTGTAHRTPVNLLTVDGRKYLVAPRGETEWVRNVRAANGQLVLILGRRRQALTATEVPVADRADILRAYLRRWKLEVAAFFDGVGPDADEAELATVAERHPVFALSGQPGPTGAAPVSR